MLMKKIFFKYISIFILTILLGISFFGGSVWADDTIRLEFDINLEGEKISGTNVYKGPVEVVIKLQDTSGKIDLWINQQNIWMLVSPQNAKITNEYRLKFSADAKYDIQFKTENHDTLEKLLQSTKFTISTNLDKTISELKKLPNPETASNSEILAAQTLIQSSGNMLNDLEEDERNKIINALTSRLDTLRSFMEKQDSPVDVTPPKSPTVEITSTSLAVSNCFSEDVLITVTPRDKDSTIMIDQGKGWENFAKSDIDKYTLNITEQGMYHFRFCAVDSQGNRSEAVSKDFNIDIDVPKILSEISRLRANLHILPLEEYVTDLENVYLRYLSLTPPRQMLVPKETTEQIVSMYEYIIDFINFNTSLLDENGRYIKVYGLYNNLKLSNKYLQRVEIKFKANRTLPPKKVDGVDGTPLVTYKIGVDPEKFEDKNIEMGGDEVKITIQLPEDLKGKQNIEMFYLDGDKALPMNAKVRSTEDNLVLYFDALKAGDYVLVSQTEAPKEKTE